MPESQAHILVVDDDPLLRELLQDTLDTIGYTAEVASDGHEALDRLNQSRFDLVITDIKMPGMDGITLHKRIRRLYPDMPVLFITGVTSPEVIGQASPAGFLAKPFRISHMEELIREALNRGREHAGAPVRRVMVVDDDDLFRDMLADTLSAHGYTPYAVQNGAQALVELEQGPVDVVISDIRMPGMDGIALLKEIKEKHPDLPVILITAFLGESESDQGASTAEADGFLSKPFETEQIIALLRSLSSPDSSNPQ